MYTQCPTCHTVYAVDAATLAQAHGNVGCGQCGATFNALTTLVETWPDTAPEVLPAYPTSPGPPILMVPVPRAALPSQTPPAGAPAPGNTPTASPSPETTDDAAERAPEAADMTATQEPEEADNSSMQAPGEADGPYTQASGEADSPASRKPGEADSPASRKPGEADSPASRKPGGADSPASQEPDAADGALADAAAQAPSSAPAPLPSFVRRARAARRPRHRAYWVLGCVVLALALATQLVWADRIALTANAATRPWLAQACTWFGCRLPPVRDLADLELLSRDVRPHPNVPDALLISATLRNNAPFTQPYPIVSITLSDLDENRIAMRRFRPSEYIADPKVRAAGLAPGATAALMFEVKDPGQNAVAFQFGFQ